jgi:hypothetical protein
MAVGFTSTFAPKQSVHIITNIMSFVQEVYSVHIYVIMFVNDLVVGISISSADAIECSDICDILLKVAL